MALFGFKKPKITTDKQEKKKSSAAPASLKTAADKKVIENKKKKLFKKDPELISRVLIKPLITEKATNLGIENKYAFEIASKANKIEVKKAIEGFYGVKPMKINIIKIKGKKVRYGRTQGRTKNTKKAVVTLKQGDKIDVFEK